MEFEMVAQKIEILILCVLFAILLTKTTSLVVPEVLVMSPLVSLQAHLPSFLSSLPLPLFLVCSCTTRSSMYSQSVYHNFVVSSRMFDLQPVLYRKS